MENLAMKTNLKYLIHYGLVAAVLVALAVILAACSSTSSTAPVTSAPASPQAPVTSAPSSPQAPVTSAPSSPQAPVTSAPSSPQAPAASTTQPNTTETVPAPSPNLTRRQGVAGTLSNINGNILSLTTQQGTVTVNVSSNTNIQKTVNGVDSQVNFPLFA